MIRREQRLDAGLFGRLALAVLAGAASFVILSFISQGLFPFVEFAVAALVVYLVARR